LISKGEHEMKNLVLIVGMLIVLAGCRKNVECMDSGTITGLDSRDCMCCGGWFIQINDTIRRFDQVPADCTIDFAKVTYPLKVKVDWKKKDTVCMGDEIVLFRLLPDK
jgi:hypothetical protein